MPQATITKARGKASHQHLPFRADVPEPHLKSRRQCDADAQQGHQIPHSPGKTDAVGKGSLKHNSVDR